VAGTVAQLKLLLSTQRQDRGLKFSDPLLKVHGHIDAPQLWQVFRPAATVLPQLEHF
jgi:hypothetical protein